MEKDKSLLGILKNTGKFGLSLILILIISKFIWNDVLGVKTDKEKISDARKQYAKSVKVEPNIDQVLIVAADSINKLCPLKIDSITELRNVALPNFKTFQYNIGIDMDYKKYDLKKLKISMDKSLMEQFKSSPDFKLFRDSNVVLVYHFLDKNGKFLFESIFNKKQ